MEQLNKKGGLQKIKPATLFGFQQQVPVTKIRGERDYWLNEILLHVQQTEPRATLQAVMWRINKNIYPRDAAGIKALHFALISASNQKDPRCAYKNYAHAFNARTKVISAC